MLQLAVDNKTMLSIRTKLILAILAFAPLAGWLVWCRLGGGILGVISSLVSTRETQPAQSSVSDALRRGAKLSSIFGRSSSLVEIGPEAPASARSMCPGYC